MQNNSLKTTWGQTNQIWPFTPPTTVVWNVAWNIRFHVLFDCSDYRKMTRFESDMQRNWIWVTSTWQYEQGLRLNSFLLSIPWGCGRHLVHHFEVFSRDLNPGALSERREGYTRFTYLDWQVPTGLQLLHPNLLLRKCTQSYIST
jgi:hypothetical protein